MHWVATARRIHRVSFPTDVCVRACTFPGHTICDDKALLQELVPPDQQIRGRATVASAGLARRLVGWREGT
jgi:hypothetical protein